MSKTGAKMDVDAADRADAADVGPEETVALYVRASTEDESLDR